MLGVLSTLRHRRRLTNLLGYSLEVDGQSMLKKTIDWDLARTRAKLVELMEPGVLGFYSSAVSVTGFSGHATDALPISIYLDVAADRKLTQ